MLSKFNFKGNNHERTVDDAGTHNHRGIALANQGKLEDSIKEFKEALQIHPNHAGAHNNLGIAYSFKGKLNEAIQEFKLALEIDPDDAATHSNLGNAYLNAGMLEDAKKECEESLRISPNHAEAHNSLGMIHIETKMFGKAIDEFRYALRISPDYFEAHLNLGNAYLNTGMLEDAKKECEESLRINPNHAEAHNNLGNVYYTQGDYVKALDCYRTFIRLALPEHRPYVEQIKDLIRQIEQMPHSHTNIRTLAEVMETNGFVLLQSKTIQDNPLTYEFSVGCKDDTNFTQETCNEAQNTITDYLRNNLPSYKELTYKLVTTLLVTESNRVKVLVAVIITDIEDGFILPEAFGLRK